MDRPAKPVALITGSGRRRVGWYIAEALAEHGYNLVVHYRTSATDAAETARHLESKGAAVLALAADLTDEAAVRTLIARTLEHFGRLDALVNCAAAWQRKRLEDVTALDVRGFFEINTLGTFLCCQHAGLTMVRQPEGGAIVNLGDWAVARPYVDYAAYFPSKGAIPALTRSLAVELGVPQSARARQLHPARPGDAAPRVARGGTPGRHPRHARPARGPRRAHRPGGAVPACQRFRHRRLSAGGWRAEHLRAGFGKLTPFTFRARSRGNGYHALPTASGR